MSVCLWIIKDWKKADKLWWGELVVKQLKVPSGMSRFLRCDELCVECWECWEWIFCCFASKAFRLKHTQSGQGPMDVRGGQNQRKCTRNGRGISSTHSRLKRCEKHLNQQPVAHSIHGWCVVKGISGHPVKKGESLGGGTRQGWNNCCCCLNRLTLMGAWGPLAQPFDDKLLRHSIDERNGEPLRENWAELNR